WSNSSPKSQTWCRPASSWQPFSDPWRFNELPLNAPRRPSAAALALMALGIALLLCGCRSGSLGSVAASVPPASVRFTEVAEPLGVTFKHTNGASGRFYLAETMGAGCAFLDFDGDGRLDLFLVNSSRLPGFTGKGPLYPALYHQRPDGTFEDVTRHAGL